jgi:hypothetical protein
MPGEKWATMPFSENTMLYRQYRMGNDFHTSVHGTRGTVSKNFNEYNFRPDAIVRQIAHTSQDNARATYYRKEYVDECASLMQRWADLLDGKTCNVTSIRQIF